jgi:hypothetical protein
MSKNDFKSAMCAYALHVVHYTSEMLIASLLRQFDAKKLEEPAINSQRTLNQSFIKGIAGLADQWAGGTGFRAEGWPAGGRCRTPGCAEFHPYNLAEPLGKRLGESSPARKKRQKSCEF